MCVCADVRALASSKQSDSEPEDFDAWLMKNAEAWEKAEQKPAIVAWISAAVLLFVFAEWLIHLPALDIVSLLHTHTDAYRHTHARTHT